MKCAVCNQNKAVKEAALDIANSGNILNTRYDFKGEIK